MPKTIAMKGLPTVSAQAVASPTERNDSVAGTWKDAAWERVGPVCGIIAVALTFMGLAIADPNTSDVDANPDQESNVIAHLFMDNRADLEFGARFQMASIVFLICFLAYLYRRIQGAEGERGWLATALLAAGGAYIAILIYLTAITLAISTIDDYGSDASIARTLSTLSWDTTSLMAAPLAVLVGSITVAALRYHALPRWLGYTGAPIALAMVVAPVSFLEGFFFFGFVVFFPWLLAISIATAIRPRLPEQAVAR
jgi:hypothetical protein